MSFANASTYIGVTAAATVIAFIFLTLYLSTNRQSNLYTHSELGRYRAKGLNASVVAFRSRTLNNVRHKVDRHAVKWQYDLMPEQCDKNISLVIAVISQPLGNKVRQAIRQTWGSLVEPRCGMKLMFVLERLLDAELQQELVIESDKYGDILQSNQFEDSYRASTIKTLQLFQWCAAFCGKSKYIVRIDDDVWLNVPGFHHFLRRNSGRGKAIGPMIDPGTRVIRDPSNKSFLSREEFPSDRLPAFMHGAIFATPVKALARILAAHSIQSSAVFLDDVYIIGQLMPMIKLSFSQLNRYSYAETVSLQRCEHKDLLAIHHAKLSHIYSYWNDPCTSYQSVCWKIFNWNHVKSLLAFFCWSKDLTLMIC